MFYDHPAGLIRVLVISVAAYVALILILRAAGKRSLAKLNAFDLVVSVALGSTLATVLLTKDVALAEGILAFAMLAGLQYGVAKASVHWSWFRRLVRAEPRLLVEDGRFIEAAIRDERVTHGEIDQAIRNQGIGRIEDVGAVVLETDGSLSVIRKSDGGELTALRCVKKSDER